VAHVVPEAREGDDLVVFLMSLPNAPVQVLQGSAALIWIVAVEGGDDVPTAIAEVTGRPIDEIGDAVRFYLNDLVERGLLVAGRPASGGPKRAPEVL
jgi:hypothetical protein